MNFLFGGLFHRVLTLAEGLKPLESENKPPTSAKDTTSDEKQWVKRVIDSVDVRNPQNNAAFRSCTPLLHKYPFAIDFINKYGHVTTEYVKNVMREISDEETLQEIETTAINCSCQNLIYYMQDGGFKWSKKGKSLLKQKRPRAYERFFK